MIDRLSFARTAADSLPGAESPTLRRDVIAEVTMHATIALAEAVRDLTLPQGPAETGTPLAVTPAPAEPDVEAVAAALFRWNTPNDPYFVITGRRGYEALEGDSYVPIVRAVIEALRLPKPPQGSAAPPTDHGVEASRPSTAETVPTPAESSLARLDQLEELAGEVRRWRAADRLFPCDTREWWDATLRFRDAVDRLTPTKDGAR